MKYPLTYSDREKLKDFAQMQAERCFPTHNALYELSRAYVVDAIKASWPQDEMVTLYNYGFAVSISQINVKRTLASENILFPIDRSGLFKPSGTRDFVLIADDEKMAAIVSWQQDAEENESRYHDNTQLYYDFIDVCPCLDWLVTLWPEAAWVFDKMDQEHDGVDDTDEATPRTMLAAASDLSKALRHVLSNNKILTGETK